MVDTTNPTASATPAAEAPATIRLPEQEAADFQGFSTKDGERAATAPNSTPAKPAAHPTRVMDDATDEDTSDTPSDGSDDPKAQQRHRSAQARISKAVAAQRNAERERDMAFRHSTLLEQRIAALEARSGSPAPTGSASKGAAQTPDLDKEPVADDYEAGEFDPQYHRDLSVYTARKEFARLEKQRESRAGNEKQQATQAEFKSKLDKFITKGENDLGEDFRDVVTDSSLKITETLAQLLVDSDLGPQIAYAMALDPEQAAKVSAMSAARQAAWFGRQEAALSSGEGDASSEGTQTAAVKPSRAARPLRDIAHGAGAASPTSSATTDFAAFERLATTQKR